MKSIINISILCFAFLVSVQISAQRLEDYLGIAAENNPQVKTAYAQFEAALRESPQVASLPDPTLSIGAFGRMMQTDMGAEKAKISLMQMFPWFGTLGVMNEAANLRAEAKFQEYLEVRSQVFLEVKLAYADLFLIDRKRELQKENLEVLETYKELALAQVKSGRAGMVEVIKITMEQDEVETELTLLEDESRYAREAFNLLLNRGKEEEVVIQEELVLTMPTALSSEASLEDHPSLQRLQKQRASYEKQKEVARKQGMPMLGVGLDYTINSKSSTAMPAMNGEDMYMPMLSLSLPIFRKKYRAAQEEAEFLEAAAEQEQISKRNELLSAFEGTQYELKKAHRLLALLERQIRRSRQTKELYLSALSNATGNFEEVLDVNQQILKLQSQELEVWRAGFAAQAKMEYLVSKQSEYEK